MTVVVSLAELVDSKPLPPIVRGSVLSEDDDSYDRDTETLGYAEGQSFIIEYCDSKGHRSLRRITVYSLVAGAGGVPCLIARCHERKATRQFRIDRVASCSDFDGVIYDDVQAFFVENFGMSAQAAATGMDKAGEERWGRILDSVRSDAVILACISRADGSVDPREVEVIQRHIGLVAERAEGMLLDTELLALDRYVKRLRPAEAAIVRAIDQLRSRGAAHIQRLVRSCVDVMDVDGRRHAAEMSAINSLSQELLGASVKFA